MDDIAKAVEERVNSILGENMKKPFKLEVSWIKDEPLKLFVESPDADLDNEIICFDIVCTDLFNCKSCSDLDVEVNNIALEIIRKALLQKCFPDYSTADYSTAYKLDYKSGIAFGETLLNCLCITFGITSLATLIWLLFF